MLYRISISSKGLITIISNVAVGKAFEFSVKCTNETKALVRTEFMYWFFQIETDNFPNQNTHVENRMNNSWNLLWNYNELDFHAPLDTHTLCFKTFGVVWKLWWFIQFFQDIYYFQYTLSIHLRNGILQNIRWKHYSLI